MAKLEAMEAAINVLGRRKLRVSGLTSFIPLLTGLPLALVGCVLFDLSISHVILGGSVVGGIATSVVIADENRASFPSAAARFPLSLFAGAVIAAFWALLILAGMFVLNAIIYPPPPEYRPGPGPGPDYNLVSRPEPLQREHT